MNQEKFNEILKSKRYKIISIDYLPFYYTYYIRKLGNEKITGKDINYLYKIKDVSYIRLKGDDYYLKLIFKK